MKLSLKFRDQDPHPHPHPQNPLLRAKIPVTILGLPFLSGLVAGDSSDLAFSLRSNFSAGPTLSVSYHPTSPSSLGNFPFSVALKSGTGLYGSPHESPLVFTARFNLFSAANPNPNSLNPIFSLHVKPQFGNFSLSKSVSSLNLSSIRVNGHCPNGILTNGSGPDFETGNGLGHGSGAEFENGVGRGLVKSVSLGAVKVDGHGLNGGLGNGSGEDLGMGDGLGGGGSVGVEKGFVWSDLKRGTRVSASSGYGEVLSGVLVAARTSMPLTKRAMVHFRWGVKLPPEGGLLSTKTRLPVLVMNKVSLERVDEKKVEDSGKRSVEEGKSGEVEVLKGMCGWMRREVEELQRENRQLKQIIESMRSQPPANTNSRVRRDDRDGVVKRAAHVEGTGEFEKWRSKKGNNGGGNGEESGNRDSKKMSEVESELQKAIKAASAS